MHSDFQTLFARLWDNYLEVTPSAQKIHRILGGTQGRPIINDHIALRTFNLDKVSLSKLAAHFEAVGYTARKDYHFEAKKLYAKHYEHPDPTAPKVFISELLVEQFSPELQKVVHSLVDQVDPEASRPTTSCIQAPIGKSTTTPTASCSKRVNTRPGLPPGAIGPTTSRSTSTTWTSSPPWNRLMTYSRATALS